MTCTQNAPGNMSGTGRNLLHLQISSYFEMNVSGGTGDSKES